MREEGKEKCERGGKERKRKKVKDKARDRDGRRDWEEERKKRVKVEKWGEEDEAR